MQTERREDSRHRPLYDGSVWRVIIVASVLIVVSTALVGVVSYRITQQEVIKDLKAGDLAILARSAASQVQGRIDRAVEMSRVLADNPAVMEWVAGAERDERLGSLVKRMLTELPDRYDYTNAFVVSAVTGQYWSETGEVLNVVSDRNPDDGWFFRTIAAGRKSTINVDYNAERGDTFVFVNVLIGDADRPLGVAGVGLSLKELSEDFAGYKLLSGSRIWMVGADGSIQLADDYSLTGANIADHLTAAALEQWNRGGADESYVFEANDRDGHKIDMIRYPIGQADMQLLVQIPRSQTTGFLTSIRSNTTVVAVLSLIVSVYFFTYISRRIADPYKRALKLNEELEAIVGERTEALSEKNRIMTESVAYANRIQQAVLPSAAVLEEVFAEHLTYWKPKDGVGGDFYWVKPDADSDGLWVAVGDCSGHGVPGALMTMLSVSLLDRIVEQARPGADSPSRVLRQLNALLKETLGQIDQEGPTDDGLDLGLFRVREGRVTYAGAGILLFIGDSEGIRRLRGDKPRIGYRRTPLDTVYTDHDIQAEKSAVYYLATDGIPDQSGGPKKLSLGKTKLMEWLASYRGLPLTEQRTRFEADMEVYKDQEHQRDDMTLFAFRLKGSCDQEER